MVRAALDKPRLWRVTAVVAALLLCGLVLVCAQGSLVIIAQRPAESKHAIALPSWERWCTRGVPRKERERLAFCARVEGRVLDSTHGPAPDEAHVAVITDFQLVVIRLPDWAATPTRGTNVVAIGPLFRARDGQREVQAFRFETA
jgi:hypothetical protein